MLEMWFERAHVKYSNVCKFLIGLAFTVLFAQKSFGTQGNSTPPTDPETLAAQTAQQKAEDEAIKSRVELLKADVEKNVILVFKKAPQVPTTKEAIPAAEACVSAAEKAANACLETFSPALQDLVPYISMISSVVSAAPGIREKCEKMTEGFGLIKTAMTAYQTLCGATQVSCNSACAKAEEANMRVAAEVKKLMAATPTSEKYKSVQAASVEASGYFKAAQASCQKYTTHLAGAALGIGQMLLSMSNSKECADKTSSEEKSKCAQNPNLPECVNCSQEQYFQHPTCICAHNPRSPGCQQAQNELITKPNQQMIPSSADSTGAVGATFGTGNNNDSLSGLGSGSNFGSSGGYGGANGGAFGSMGGGGGAVAGKAADGTPGVTGKGLNANILSGEGGGGGGVGGYRSGNSASDNPYNRFLPSVSPNSTGNKSDRATASLQNQITGSNGLSNFEKVKRRYLANKSTLLSR